jgi:hypothetical protein
MNILRTTITGLFLFSTFTVWASKPMEINSDEPTANHHILHEDSLWQFTGGDATDLSKYGISIVWYKRMEYSAKVGCTFTPNGANPSLFSNPEFGISFGGSVALPLTNNFGVKLDLLYVQYVFSGEKSIDNVPTTYINRLSYIDIPLELRIKPLNDLDLYLLAGGDFSFKLANSYTYAEVPANPTVLNNNIKSPNVGYVFGIEYTVYEITGELSVRGDIPDNNNLPSPKTLVGQFTLSYTFHTQE